MKAALRGTGGVLPPDPTKEGVGLPSGFHLMRRGREEERKGEREREKEQENYDLVLVSVLL